MRLRRTISHGPEQGAPCCWQFRTQIVRPTIARSGVRTWRQGQDGSVGSWADDDPRGLTTWPRCNLEPGAMPAPRGDPAAVVAAVAGRRHRQRPGPRPRIPLPGRPPGLRRRLGRPGGRPIPQPGPDRGRAGRHGRHRPGTGRWDRSQAGHPHPARPGLGDHPPARPGQDRHPGGRVRGQCRPFSEGPSRHGQDLAIIWIDSHPDIGTPASHYPGFHAMPWPP